MIFIAVAKRNSGESPASRGSGRFREHGGFGSRIRQFAELYYADRGGMAGIAKEAEISPNQLLTYDDEKLPSGSTLRKLGSLKPIPINIDWLIFDRGEMVPVTLSLDQRLELAITTIQEAREQFGQRTAGLSGPDPSDRDPFFDAPVIQGDELARNRIQAEADVPASHALRGGEDSTLVPEPPAAVKKPR